MHPRSLALLLATCLLLLGSAVPAGAYTFQPGARRWETARVPYWVGSASLSTPALRAARAWNALGLRVVLVRVRTRHAAFVTLRNRGSGCYGGLTQVLTGRDTGPRASIGYIARARVLVAPGCGRDLTTFVIAHELGHVLGLAHESRGCALMNPSGDRMGQSRQCPRWPLADRARDPIRADDIVGAEALYRRPLLGRLLAYRRYFPF